MKSPIPDAVLTQHTAVLGKTGSGKTSTEKLAVEQVVAAGYRVCVLDTIKSDWWGITSSASGKQAGLPFKILGGPHGHVPLHSSAGKAIGQLVGGGKLPLSIIDMADFEAGGIQRFFVDFAPALMRSAKGVLYLVIEEAHELAPKERAGFGAENMAIHWAKKLATAGRSKGIRLIVATQRVQSLHNAVLGSCETIIAHRLTTPADQKPVLDWLKANATGGVIEMVAAQLSSLKTGSAWVCSGEARLFERIEFPKFKTYDNTATPTGDDGAGDHDVKTAAVNADELRAIIGDAVKDAEANDPRTLRAEIVRLKAEMAKAPTLGTINIGTMIDAVTAKGYRVLPAAELQQQLQREYGRGKIEGYGEAIKDIGSTHRALLKAVAQVKDAIGNVERTGASMETWLAKLEERQVEFKSTGSPAAKPAAPAPRARPAHNPTARSQPSPANPVGGDGNLSPALQKAIDAIAWWRKIGIEPVERARASVVAGYSPRASTFGVYIADLAKRGYVDISPGKLKLTAEGLAIANIPTATTAEDLKHMARELLAPQEARVFDVVYAAYPDEIRRDEVARQVGLSPTASTVGVYIAGVAAYGIIEAKSPGAVRAAEWLFQ